MPHSNTQMPSAAPAGSFVVAAPGRVNLIGEHTDYNGGLVLPMAIDLGIQITVRPRRDRLVVMQSERGGEAVTLDLSRPLAAGRRDWACYPAGVLAGYQRLGWDIPGFEAQITATLPIGGGLSSSAALEVATATVVETLCGKALPLEQKALLCQQAEHEFAGVPCGIMDQFAVTFAKAGHALLLDCRDRSMRHVPMPGDEVGVLIINSGVKHSLADSEYPQRRAQCESAARLLGVVSLRDVSFKDWESGQAALPELECKRARHVLTEHQRTLAFVSALEQANWQKAGALMHGSHESLRDDFAVSCTELDALVDISHTIDGVHGCRMTGGGFGGCVVALIETVRAAQIMAEFRKAYMSQIGVEASMFVTQAAEGPRVKCLKSSVISQSKPNQTA
jgi:galactokinase